MTFCIISHTPHTIYGNKVYAYGPYVKEMNLWVKYVDKVIIVAPCIINEEISPILLPYEHSNIVIKNIPAISIISFLEALKAMVSIPVINLKIFLAMLKSNHIHLRCPGNIGLLGCITQILFPRKSKTAKYAGNWDPKAKQPLSYRFQKWILSNTFLTKKMKVLVYGEWPRQTKNIIPFFTASYTKKEVPKQAIHKSFQSPFRMMFVGTLSEGKQPLYALQLVENLNHLGFPTTIEFFGEGNQRSTLQSYIETKNLTSIAILHGNKTFKDLEKAYKQNHFVILPSKSEGWPKVVAEAMFWGAIPIATRISCVPWMLGEGSRGFLLEGTLEVDSKMLVEQWQQTDQLQKMSMEGQKWSQNYTLDRFEEGIIKILS
ncbi:MAG: glycosyl transferase [Flavobacteriaceae bacterium]|nr:glycosyl transferase [Flavobacteriaceae bacterium]